MKVRFARAVGAEEADGPRGDGKAHAVQGLLFSKGLGQRVAFQ